MVVTAINRLKKVPTLSSKDEARFWEKVDITQCSTDCWNWKANRNLTGYGVFKIQGKNYQAHRVAYALKNGSIPEDKPFVCHSCDNPSCVNLDHLFAGTHCDNMDDKVIKGRQSQGDLHSSIMFRVAAKGENNAMRKYPELVLKGDNHPSRLHPENMARGCRHGSKTKPHRVAKGERVNTSKLNEGLVREIRRLHREDRITSNILSNQFGINFSTVRRIINRITWKHII